MNLRESLLHLIINLCFISFQHPNAGNATAQTDAAGNAVIFNTSTTVVVAHSNALGPLATLPVTFTGFLLKPVSNGVIINWSVAQAFNHSYFAIERSADGIHFEDIHRNNDILNDNESRSFHYTDQQTVTGKIFYRIRQCDVNGSCRYSEIRSILFTGIENISLYPVPAGNSVNIRYISKHETMITISVIDRIGRTVQKEKRKVVKGVNTLALAIQKLNKGNYSVIIRDGESESHHSFIKL